MLKFTFNRLFNNTLESIIPKEEEIKKLNNDVKIKDEAIKGVLEAEKFLTAEKLKREFEEDEKLELERLPELPTKVASRIIPASSSDAENVIQLMPIQFDESNDWRIDGIDTKEIPISIQHLFQRSADSKYPLQYLSPTREGLLYSKTEIEVIQKETQHYVDKEFDFSTVSTSSMHNMTLYSSNNEKNQSENTMQKKITRITETEKISVCKEFVVRKGVIEKLKLTILETLIEPKISPEEDELFKSLSISKTLLNFEKSYDEFLNLTCITIIKGKKILFG
ncbi:hypothetical protein HDU92_007044 [Lobulomyces angularis]|nr:hypothetical protein HDU92_007044 [Lobulomyces angularis]